MPTRRWLSALIVPLLLSSCDDRALQKRTEQIRQLSDKEDRAYMAQAVRQIGRKYWSVRGDDWLGKLEDGTIVILRAPHATAAPLPSRAFYSGWHLQLTISTGEWRTDPASVHREPFRAVYAITRHSAMAWDIRVTDGSVTAPLRREDAMRLHGEY